MVAPLLRDPVLWQRLQHVGYVQVPLLPPDVVAQLRDEFHRWHAELAPAGFVSTTYGCDYAHKKSVSDSIVGILGPWLEPLFTDHRVLGAAFLYKVPGAQSALPLHQDWTVVDEDRFIAANLWFPLVDADIGNGTLCALPGSHRVMRGLRAPTLPFCFSGHEALVQRQMLPLPTPAGHAVVINQATAHHSPANLGPAVRPAITVGVVSAAAPLHFYYRDRERSDGRVEVFEQDDDFFLRFDDFHRDIFRRPRFGRATGEIEYAAPAPSAEEVQALVDACRREVQAPRPVLRDAAAEQALTRDGFAVLTLCDAAALERLLDRLTALVPTFPEGFYASVREPEAELRAAINALLVEAFGAAVAAAGIDLALLGGAFINKAPGPRGVLPPHQDWNIVDESRHRSFNLWVPLVDTDLHNGTIQVVPGSHLGPPSLRGPDIPCVYRQAHAALLEAMQPLPLQRGQALVYDHRLLHASGVNHSGRARPGAVMGLAPVEAAAELKYYRGEGGRVSRYASSAAFLLGGRTEAPPPGATAEAVIDHDSTAWPLQQVTELLDAWRRQAARTATT